ncbi:mitochondrial cytochrome c oxidase 20 [Pyrrhoderma noxium]|uniref:Cytochrome c oxidase assembly protein COX20, mitochondrial n=1 Tax=Pyrrhoderma noxium TaxID=2282107 RepID=A0A286UBW8_9AGAM|nr:mitochondrial cytochrome c oxidase 20 [Pyrrhoderma noxium]
MSTSNPSSSSSSSLTPSSASQETPSSIPPENANPAAAEQIFSTGNRWADYKLAAKRISFWDDLKHIGEIPCARNSLLLGISAGTGIGFVRGFNTKPFIAANWAMGTFLVVSVGSWNVCRANIRREREQVRVVMEQMAGRRLRRAEQDENVKGDQPDKSL